MADPTIAHYRAFWVDTFNTPLNNHRDVAAVVANATAAGANAIFAQVRRRGDTWYRTRGSRCAMGCRSRPALTPWPS